jgi:DNA-binding transcriptional ArsR family regulator
MQQQELIVTRVEQARALQETGLLAPYLEPASPSDVARRLGIPANLAHHHARRHASLGLLNQVKRERGRVYYQLAARTFKHCRSLLPAGDPNEHTTVMLGSLRERFLAAYERSDRIEGGQNPNWHIYGFDRQALPQEPRPERDALPSEPRPAHFLARTLSLSPRRYRALVREITELISEAESADGQAEATCTLAFIAMDGTLQEGSRDSHYLSTFVSPVEPDDDPKSWKP